jgi:hypothetical protein
VWRLLTRGGDEAMIKALGLAVFFLFVVHFYMLAQTGHLNPCEAAFHKLEMGNITDYKNKHRELIADPEEQPLYDAINRGDVLACYRIALF